MFIQEDFNSIFSEKIYPELISIYSAEGQYTAMPRAMHSHTDKIEFILITGGYGLHVLDNQDYYTEKGDLIILNAGVLHDESSRGTNLSVLTCAVKNLRMAGCKTNTLLKHNESPIIKTGDDFIHIKELFLLIHRSVYEKHQYFEEYSNYLLRALLILIFDLAHKNAQKIYAKNENKVDRDIKHYIDKNYTQNLNLNNMAEKIHVSPYYLSHIFKKIYGQSPRQYLIRRRIGEAQTLLIDTDMAITDIALSTGYNNLSHFNTSFVKITGFPPSKYRKNYHKI